MSSGRTPIDARALTKKLDRTACDPAARAILGSLLLYVSGREDGPPTGVRRPSRQPESQEAARRPTRFQLLQAKFLGSGREPHLKRTREVGRLIPRDRHGPGRGLVSTTISKLLDKTKERAGDPGEKPRCSPPTGKSTVKSILKKFLAAEEKEAQETAARERPPAERPRAPTGLLPKVVGKSSVLSKLREKFEQSACLCSEAGLLPLRREERKKRNLQRKKMHRPEVRVLHTATMASTCVRTPPARFLACTAEPLPALSVATVVCGPRSWLSRCTKISHAGARRQPGREAGLRPDAGEAEPSGEGAHGTGPLQGEPREQPQAPAQRGGPEAVAPALPCVGPDSPALPGHVSALSLPSPLGSPSPSGARTVGATAGSAAFGSWEGRDARAAGPAGPLHEGAGQVPEVAMTVCSSEDEVPESEREPLFATQKHFPEQNGPQCIPPLHTPAVRAARRAQPAVEPPRITVQRPVVHEMPPAPACLGHAPPSRDVPSPERGAESAVESAHAGAGRAPAELGGPSGTPAGPRPSPTQGAPAGPSPAPPPGAAGADGSFPDAAAMQKPGGKGSGRGLESPNSPKHCEDISVENTSEPLDAGHPGPEPGGTPKPDDGPSSHNPTTRKGHLRRNSCGPSGGQHAPSLGGSSLTGAPTSPVAPPGGRVGPEAFAARGAGGLCTQGPRQGPPARSAQPLQVAQGNASRDFGKNGLSSFDERPKPSIEVPREMTGAAGVAGHAPPLPGSGRHPEHPGGEDGCGTPATGPRAAEGGGLVGQCLPQEPDPPHVWAPGAAAERSVLQGPASTVGPPAPHPQGAAHPSPVPCATREPAARESIAAAGGRDRGAEAGSPPGLDAQPPAPASTCHRPWGASPAGPSLGPGELLSPSENPRAAHREGLASEKQPPLGAELARPPPTAPSTESGAAQAGRAQERSPPDPCARSDPEAKSPGGEGPVLLSQGRQESQPAQGSTASGCVRSQQTPQPGGSGRSTVLLGPKVVQNLAKQPQAQLQSAQDLATEVGSPCPHSHKGQAGAPGPWAEQGRSPGQGQDTWAAKNPDTPPGSPEGLGSLAAQGQVQGQPQGQPQGQVQGQPQIQVQGQPQIQVQGQVKGQPQIQVQGQPQGQVQGQPQGQGQVQRQPQGQVQGQVKGQPQGQVQGQPQGQVQGQPQGQVKGQPQIQVQGQVQGQPQGQPQGQGQVQGQVQRQPQGQVQGQVKGQPQGQAPGQVQGQPQGQVQGQVKGQPQGQAPGQVQGQPQGQVQGQVKGQPQGQAPGQVKGQPQGQVQGWVQGQVQKQPQGRVQEQVQGQVQRQPQGQVQGQVKGQPQGQAPGQVQGQPQGRVQRQAWASRTAPPAREQPVAGAAGGAPAAGGSRGWGTAAPREGGQGDPAARSLPQGSQLPGGKSSTAPALEPANGSAMPVPGAGGCQSARPEGQEGLPSRPGAQRGPRGELAVPEQERRRKPSPLAKYRAQSFSDQRSFDLSFRPASLRASDTFDLPK
ncbi:collagen alpha-1(I) chain-like isoform X2 [Lemur catta]|uniref:collagen alpha-1(I) chain-like isoform X2 n=1 Tax=Lemur catta TaxID=9447 RepID=UPI001E2676C6|nr:collagen alpha-1(I) chain-like isoform X2 [Lemur catta]